MRLRSSSRSHGTFIFFLICFAIIVLSSLKAKMSDQMIIVVTPTYKRLTRIADMIRMANTLSHVKNLHWIVIEDGNKKIPAVENILKRTNLPYTYFPFKTIEGYPKRGWYQRTMALKFIRSNTSQILGKEHKEGVVYFGDDDNSYDIRLFTEYIRNVKTLGIWAVGLVGGGYVEAPKVVNGTVPEFNVGYLPSRTFAVDMAGFAVNLRVVMNSTAVFGLHCKERYAPETCLLEDMGLERKDIEPFGWEGEKDREILVWHTKTSTPNIPKAEKNATKPAPPPETYGYFVEV